MFTRTLSSIMPKPLNVDWPAVRVLAVAVGVREAARQMGISEDAVRQRSKREGWLTSAKAAAQRALAKHVTEVSPSALSPADALASALSDDSRETKLGLSAAARNAAKAFAQMPGDRVIEKAQQLRHVTASSSHVHGWEQQRQGEEILNLNVLTAVKVVREDRDKEVSD
jgi:hypothetical protein